VSKTLVTVAAAVALIAGGLLWANAPIPPLPVNAKADLLVVDKAARNLSLYSHGALIVSYPVSLGRAPVGAKAREGDHRTPEGRYFVDRHKADSAFHLALHVSYPSAQDSARAQAAGYSPGSDVMVHGMRNGLGWLGRAHLLVNWTNGCVAVTNAEMAQIYSAVPDGTPIEFRP
jgi:murein L,D-transpeptidase YafK